MRWTCKTLFKCQYKQMSGYFIPFCKKSNQKQYPNVLIMINMLCHIYIQSELYILTYVNDLYWYKKTDFLVMIKCNDSNPI